MSAAAILQLQRVGFTQEQVEALADFLDDRVDLSQLATKADLAHLATKVEVAELRGEVRAGMADLRGEIARSKNSLLMWLIPLLLAQIGGLLFLILRPVVGP